MQTKTITDASGRVVVQLHDDGGAAPYHFISDSVSIIGQSEMVQVIDIDLKRTDQVTPPRPPLVRGQILVSGSMTFLQFVDHDFGNIDVEVLGYIGSTPTTIGRASLAGVHPILRVTFGDRDTFDRITVRARVMLDGVPSSSTTDVLEASVQATAVMWN